MTLPENTRPLRTNELPPPGTRVYVPEGTAAFVGVEPTHGWQTVGATNGNNSTVAVDTPDGYTSWVLSHNLLVEDEARLTVGDIVTVDAPGEKYHGMTGMLAEDDGTDLPYWVRFETGGAEWFTPSQVSLVSDGDTFPGEEDTTAPVSVRHETVVTLAAPATAFQISRALALIPLGWFTTVDTYADRIEIIGRHHEETRG